MKDIKEKAKMKEPKVHNPASRAPKDMKAAIVDELNKILSICDKL